MKQLLINSLKQLGIIAIIYVVLGIIGLLLAFASLYLGQVIILKYLPAYEKESVFTMLFIWAILFLALLFKVDKIYKVIQNKYPII